jgi:two-component system phosphate regulon response regulator PhoB
MLSLDLPQSPSSPDLAQANRILVVEDEDLIREMLVLALEEEGYEVVTAVDGRTALALLQDAEPTDGEFPFNLLILDLMLPQINGLDLCRLLRYREILCQF